MSSYKVESFTFMEKLKEGEQGEDLMDDFFKTWFHIQKVSVQNQVKYHYDRDFILKTNQSTRFKIEYKTDLMAVRTGNFFVECDMSDGGRGWLYKTNADWIGVLIGSEIYLVDINVLRFNILKNSEKYKKRNSRPTKKFNVSYHSTGYLMPLNDLKSISNIYIIVS